MMNLANKITLARVILIPFFIVALMAPIFDAPLNRYIAVVIFAVASATDFLDGYIARSRNLVTNFGKFADPLADKLLVCAALVCMVELGDLSAWVVFILLAREFIITGFRLIAVEEGIVIAAGNMGKFKTVEQMLMILFVLLGIRGGIYDVIAWILIALAVILSVASCVEYIMKNIKVLKK